MSSDDPVSVPTEDVARVVPDDVVSASPEFVRNSVHVLVADDDPDFLKLFEWALERADLPIVAHFVNDGQEVLDYLSADGADSGAQPRPAFIVLDVKMPRLTGPEALRVIQQDPELQEIPFRIHSTAPDPDETEFAVMTKPTYDDEWRELLERIPLSD